MRDRLGSHFLGVLLGLGLLADAHAATLTVEPAAVELGGTVTFTITTEEGALPGAGERPALLYFNGPCTNEIKLHDTPIGSDFVFTLPGEHWENYVRRCSTVSEPGAYIATFQYYLQDGMGGFTLERIDVPFTVLAPISVEVTPNRIPAGGKVVVHGHLNPGIPATLAVYCPNIDFSLAEFDDDFAVNFPSVSFAGSCDTTQPGRHFVNLFTETQAAPVASFWVYGDRDHDGRFDPDDNCVDDPNPDQADADHDGLGDVCDPDDDGDGVYDVEDDCPEVANTSQDDLDGNGLGDACDPDIDGDGVENESDNCPYQPNPEQDEVCVANPDDADGDGQGNLGDNCPDVFNPTQQDDDGDGIGNSCDLDIDGDGLPNATEAGAGTDPRQPDTKSDDVISFWKGTVLTPNDVVEEGDTVGVVIAPDPAEDFVHVIVIDPVNSPYRVIDFPGFTPVGFSFVPILAGEWRIEAHLGSGVVAASVQVIPEPGAALGGGIGMATLLGVAAHRRRN